MAFPREPQSTLENMEFLIGNTATPVYGRYILKAELAHRVISVFVERGERSDLVDWEEI